MRGKGEDLQYTVKVRTVEVTVPPAFRDWSPIGHPLMLAQNCDTVELRGYVGMKLVKTKPDPLKHLLPLQGKNLLSDTHPVVTCA